jgi:hypothetical protein
MPVLARIGAAGWQPVTHARAGTLRVERFGSTAGSLYFAVHNKGSAERSETVRVDARALGLKPHVTVRELVRGQDLRITREQAGIGIPLSVGPGETRVLALSGGK